jgi:hypothetical protein
MRVLAESEQERGALCAFDKAVMWFQVISDYVRVKSVRLKPLAKNLNRFRQIQGSARNLKFLLLRPIVNPVVMPTVNLNVFECCCLSSRTSQVDTDRPSRIVNRGNFDA